ncbi:hypothetical protein C100_09020 [Sphingobium sp. C100]|nr:hypothetical protein C100_09020 [Sphingobium sp. C100]
MFSWFRWRSRLTDQRSALRPSRHSFRKPWWRRSGRGWLLLALLLLLIAAIAVLLGSARALPVAAHGSVEMADSS